LFIPMTLRDQKIFYYMCRFTASLASLDVFALSIIIAVSQLEQFSLFIQGEHCTLIKKYIIHDMDCFRVKTELLSGCWLLFFCAFIVQVVTLSLFHLSEIVIVERENQALEDVRNRNVTGEVVDVS
jgi:hypothetical protein